MGRRLERAARAILAHPYVDKKGGKTAELIFAETITDNLQAQYHPRGFPKSADGERRVLSPGSHVIVNPLGSQQSPDILVLTLRRAWRPPSRVVTLADLEGHEGDGGIVTWPPQLDGVGSCLLIEVKSSKTGAPMWNSGLPSPGTAYILTTVDGKVSGTTAVMGEELVNPAFLRFSNELRRFLWGQRHAINGKLDEDFPDHGFRLQHLRPMYEALPGNRRWLTHPHRVSRETQFLKACIEYDETHA
jgi:hypothetical protein